MDLRYSLPCLLVVVLSICAAPVIRQQQAAFMHGSLEMPPAVLAQKGREIAAALGYTRKPADTNIALEDRSPLDTFLGEKPEPRKWDEWLASEAPIMAVYRESQSPLLAPPFGYVTATNPPPIDPGMVFERIDGHGILREFSAIPYDDMSAGAPADFEAVFRAAALDPKTFTETTPTLLPQHAADEVRAWKGFHPKIPNTELVIEAAAWKGRVTQVLVEFPWSRSPNAAGANRNFLLKIRGLFLMISIGCAGFFGILYSRRNWKKGRVDKKGALRLAIAAFVIGMIDWAGQVHPIPTDDMLSLVYAVTGDSVLFAAMLWVLYLALEPAVRSSWPHAIVTWNRVLAGRWKDAQVSAHVLIGAALGMAMWTITMFVGAQKDKLTPDISLWPLLGNRQLIAAYALNMREAMVIGMSAFFAIFGLRHLLKKDWLAAVAASLLFTVSQPTIFTDPQWEKETIVYVILYAILMFVLIRVGLLTTVSAIFFLNALNRVCLGSDWNGWWAPSGFTGIIFLLILAFYAFWRSIGTRELAE